MNKWRAKLTAILVLIFIITVAVIYFTVDHTTLLYLQQFKSKFLIFALISLTIGMLFDALRVTRLAKGVCEYVSFQDALKVVFSNYFLAALTPGAAGGAIAQVFFLRRSGVPLGKATGIVLTRTVFSILFLVVSFPFVMVYDPVLMPLFGSSKQIIILLLVGLVATLYGSWVLKAKPSALIWLRDKLLALPRIGQYLHQKNFGQRFDSFIAEMAEVGTLFSRKSLPLLVEVFGFSAISLLFLYALVPALLAGVNVVFDFAQVMGRMILINFLLYFAPTPGGAGIAEGGFMLLFGDIIPTGILGIIAVGWRILSEYLPFTIGLVITLHEAGAVGINKLVGSTNAGGE